MADVKFTDRAPMTNPKLADELTALAEKAGAFGGPVDLDAQNLLRRDLVNNLPEILAALTARSDGCLLGDLHIDLHNGEKCPECGYNPETTP